jgi:2-iminobutanoate/2-iminopropanoate deaminase
MPKIETIRGLNNENAPYSAVVKIDKHYHFSGVVPKLNEKNEIESPEDIGLQTKEVLDRISGLLEACGLTPKNVYGATVMLGGSMAGFATVNKVYSDFFAGVKIKPRRKAFAVAELPFKALVEIEIDAVEE